MRSAHLRVAVLLLHALLLAGIPAWLGFSRAWPALPLLLPLHGLWRGRPYTYAWASLLLIFYAGALLMEAIRANPAAIALASVAVLEFCGLLLYVRVRAAESRQPT